MFTFAGDLVHFLVAVRSPCGRGWSPSGLTGVLDAGRANICCRPGHRVSTPDHRLAPALNAGQRRSPPCNTTCWQTFACRLLTPINAGLSHLAKVCRYRARVQRLPACCCRLVSWYGAELERDGIREASLRCGTADTPSSGAVP